MTVHSGKEPVTFREKAGVTGSEHLESLPRFLCEEIHKPERCVVQKYPTFTSRRANKKEVFCNANNLAVK